MTRQEQAELRAYVMTRRDVERVRITREGEVHAYGRMPNSIVVGWYLFGDAGTVLADKRDEDQFRAERNAR